LALDLSFIHRVYRTGLILTVLGAAFFWEVIGPKACFGWLVGAVLSLLMLAGVEWSIKRFIQPESQSARGLIGVLVVKMVGASAILVLSFIAALKGWLSILYVLFGFAMPHLVVVLKLAGIKLREFYAASDPPPTPRV
jgi:hypothetical protein